jgi:hypothetical protein
MKMTTLTGSEIDRIKNEDLKKIPVYSRIIRGRLTPSNIEDVKKLHWNLHRLERVFTEYQLQELTMWNAEWRNRHIAFGNIAPAYDGLNTAPNFVESLRAAMQTEVAKELELSGEFMLTIETRQEPKVFRITVNNGEVICNQAELVW